ncbi:MAG: LPD38 domain-containing protein [Acutalibacteraceae bacterium]
MAAVKDPDYSSKIKFLSDYSMNYGYKDKKYAKEYTKELENTIKELENDGYKNETSDPDNITFINKNKNKIDELKNKLSEFQKKVAAQDKINAEKNTIEIIKKNKDFSEKTKNVDYNKFFQGFDKAGTEYDRGFIGEAKDENKEAWYNYVAKDDRLKINAELYNVNINALDDDQKNTLVYLFKKIGDNNIDEAIKNGEVITDGTEQGKLAAEKELKAKDTRKLINFIKQIKNDEDFNARNESAQQQAIKDSSAANKVLSYAETFATKPLADTATKIGSYVQAITGGIDTESDFYKASNHIRKTRSGVSESVKENYGNTVGFVFDLGTNAADIVIQFALAHIIGNGLKYANYGSEMKSAQKAFSYASKALLANSAYADSLLSAKEKGLSDGQSLALGTIAGAAEVLTERFGLENLFQIFNKGLEKTTGKSVIKELSKQMFFEGSEEVASDIINTIADIAIAKDESDFISSVNQYKEQGLSEGKAVAKTLKDTALDYGQDFLSGALMGLVMGGVGTVKNVKAYNSAVKSESLGVSKILLLDENQTQELISKAKEQGVKTEKFENEYKKLEAAAETAIDGTDESAEKYSEQFDRTAAEFDKIRNKIKDKSGKKAKDTNDIFNQFFNSKSKNNSVDVQADTSSVDNTNNSVEDDSLDTNGAFVDNTESNINAENSVDENTDSTPFVINKLQRDNKLAKIKQTAKSETAVNDLTEHIDDTYYKIVYNETVNTDENSKDTSATAKVGETPSVSGADSYLKERAFAGNVSVEERSAEFNRIYDMGLDEDIPPYEIESDIFSPEQVRRIYAAAVIDDNIRNKLGRDISFTSLLKEYEDKALKNAKNNSKKSKQVKVDKLSGNQYNKKRGEENEKNSNSELLERRGVSAVSGNSNILRQQDNGTAEISRGLQGSTDVLGISRQSKTERSDWLGNNERKHAGRNRKQGQESRRFSKSSIGNLSRVTLNGKDTAGRILDKNVIKEFSNTVFKTQDGKLLSLYHWTDKNFKTFKYGDIGFHFGTYSAAEKRKADIERERAVNESIYKEVYINIKNPIIINYDPMSWRVFSAAYKLVETGIISERDIKNLENLDGFYNGKYNSPASIEFRKILESKGYDGIIYSNDYEGDYSVIALSPGQIYTVSENDIDIKKAEDNNSPAFSVGEKNNQPKQSGKNKKSSLSDVADEQDSANTLEANSGTTTSDNILSKNSENVKENEKNALKKYSEHQIENWKNSKSIVVYENEQQLKDFVDEALNNKNLNKKMYFGIISDDTANIVLKKTGANIKNYNISLKGYEIKKILNNSHGNEIQESLRGQRAITFDDIKMIPEIISYPDEIMLDSKLYQGKPVLKFFKTINGKTTVVTYVSDKHKDLTVQTMYSGKNKKGNLATATDVLPKSNPLSLTSETTVGTVTSDNSILNSDENVKNGEKNSENIQKSIKNQSSAEEWTADYKNENSEYKEAPAITEIVKTISEEFNIPISKGKYKGRALGIYKTQAKTARTRVTNALPTVLHEALGHHLDNKYHFTEKAENIEELISKIKELSPGWIEQYKKSEQPYEAFAEFLREYATDKTRAKVNFPNYFVEFEKTLKSANNDDFKKLQKVADMTNAYMASTRNERRKSAVITRAEAERRHKKAENLSTRFNKIRARIQDEAIALKPLGNAYSQYYSAKQADMRIYSTITGDYMTGIDGNYAYKTDDNGKYLRDKNGNKILQKSMANILSALPDGKADSDFSDYLVIKHAIEWINEDKRVYADDTLNDAEYLKQEVQKYEKKYPMYKQVSEELYEYQNELLKQWLVAGGLMTYDDVKELKQAYPCYVPFQRDVGDVKNISSKAKGSISNQNTGIKRAKGSGLDILSPIESIMINTEKYIKSAERNTVMREIADFVQKNSGFGYLLEEVEPDRSPNSIDAFPVKAQVMEILQAENINSDLYFDIDEALNKALGTSLTEWVVKDNQGRDIVYVSENGEKKFFQVHDKELLIALNGLNKPQLNGVIKFMSGASRVMKATTTGLNVFWSLRSNMLRDFDSAYKYSKEKNFAVFVKDYVTAMGNAITKSDKYMEYQAAGGGYSSIISNPKTLTYILNKLYKTDEGKIRTFLKNKMQLIELIEGISDVIEAGPRFAEYERVLKETGNKRKAILAADEITVNFKRKGSLTNTIEPFFSYFNAGVQGVSKVVTTLADKNTNKSFIVKSMVMAVISSALIFGWNRLIFDDDDEYEKLSAYKRNNFYNFYVGNGKFISIPKSKDTAFLNSLFENIIYELTTDNHDFCENFKNFSSYVFDTFLPAGIPNPVEINSIFSIPEQILSDTTLFGSVAEAMSNQNYMGFPIVPSQYENLEPWSQYDEHTTAIAKWLGNIFNFSPMKIDHIITSNTGMIGDLLKDLTADEKNFALGFDSYISDSAYSNDIVNNFYDDFDSVEKRKNTAVKHNPDTAGKDYAVYSQYSMYKSIASVYNSYADSDEKNAGQYKALRRDLLNDFNLNIAGKVDKRLVKLYNSTKDSEIFSSKSFNDEVTVDDKKYKISLDNFIKFFDEYNKQIKEAYEPILENDSLSDEQKVKQLKTTKTEIYNDLAEYYAAQTNNFDSDIAEYEKAGMMKPADFIKAMNIIKPEFADTDGDGSVSAEEKNNAIENSNISADVKTLMQALNIMGSKKIDTDNDGRTDTNFDDLPAKEQKAYINKNNSDILKMLKEDIITKEKSEYSAGYRKELEEKVNVISYPQNKRIQAQSVIDQVVKASAGLEVEDDTSYVGYKTGIEFDESGFIDIENYIRFKTELNYYNNKKKKEAEKEKAKAKKSGKSELEVNIAGHAEQAGKAKQLELINQLNTSDGQKNRLKLWVLASGRKIDINNDGTKDVYFNDLSSAQKEEYLKNNINYIISNTDDDILAYWNYKKSRKG